MDTIRVGIVVVLLILGMTISQSALAAQADRFDSRAELQQGLIDVSASSHTRGGGGPSRGRSGAPGTTSIAVPGCMPSPIAPEMCAARLASCPPGQIRMQVWSGPADAPIEGRTAQGEPCLGGSGASGPPQIVVSQSDFQSLPVPAGEFTVQPPGGYVLIGMRTNVYAASTEPTVLSTSVLGQPVHVRAIPVSWTWDFGDGHKIGPVDDPGAAYPAVRHAHRYAADGTFTITMTTTYRGEYSVAGGPWLPVEGQAQATSPGVPVIALAGQTQLTAD